MYIHVQSSGMFYKNSMMMNMVCNFVNFILMIFVCLRLYALFQCCTLIAGYYSVVGEPQESADLCLRSIVYYLSWLFVSLFLLTFLRLLSFYYMFKSYRYIKKREEDALKKNKRKMELSHRARKNKIMRVKLQKKIREKKLIERARRGELEAMNESI